MNSICGRTYDDGEPCMGNLVDTEDGMIECEVCYAVSLQLVRRKGQLLLTYEGRLADRVLGFQTQNMEDN